MNYSDFFLLENKTFKRHLHVMSYQHPCDHLTKRLCFWGGLLVCLSFFFFVFVFLPTLSSPRLQAVGGQLRAVCISDSDNGPPCHHQIT